MLLMCEFVYMNFKYNFFIPSELNYCVILFPVQGSKRCSIVEKVQYGIPIDFVFSFQNEV